MPPRPRVPYSFLSDEKKTSEYLKRFQWRYPEKYPPAVKSYPQSRRDRVSTLSVKQKLISGRHGDEFRVGSNQQKFSHQKEQESRGYKEVPEY